MANHDYSPQEALDILVRKLAVRNPELAEHIRAIVNQGRDIQEIEPPSGERRKKSRVYRKTIPYPYDEAVQVALQALATYFIEQPLFIESCLDNMNKAAVGTLRGFKYLRSPGNKAAAGIIAGTEMTEKEVQIELRTETELPTEIQLSSAVHDTEILRRTPVLQVNEQRENIAKLKALFEFGDQ